MPTLVISDIHGRAERLLALVERYPGHEMICLGGNPERPQTQPIF